MAVENPNGPATTIVQRPPDVGYLPFIFSGLSFIPCIGLPFGLTALIWGIVASIDKKRGAILLAILGGLGTCITVMIFVGLYVVLPALGSLLDQSGAFVDARKDLSITNMNSLVQAIEFYKVQNGEYPDNLQVLAGAQSDGFPVSIYDFTSMAGDSSMPREFYYQVIDGGRFYVLLGVGPDGLPFTPDDLLPTVDNRGTGLWIDPRSN